MIEFDDAAVAAAMDPRLLIDEVGRCLADLGTGSAMQMPKAAMPIAPGAFFLSVAGVVPRLGLAASKWASYVPGPAGQPGHSTSRITVSDSTTGDALATITGMVATQARTAATAVAAARRFLLAPASSVAFVGFGGTNRAVFDLLTAVGDLPSDVRILVRSPESRDAISQELPGVLVTTDSASAVAGAGLAFSATGSPEALAAVESLAPGAVVVSLDGSGTWTSGSTAVILTDRVVDGAAPSVAVAFASGAEVRNQSSQQVLLDIAGCAVTDVALAAIVLGVIS